MGHTPPRGSWFSLSIISRMWKGPDRAGFVSSNNNESVGDKAVITLDFTIRPLDGIKSGVEVPVHKGSL